MRTFEGFAHFSDETPLVVKVGTILVEAVDAALLVPVPAQLFVEVLDVYSISSFSFVSTQAFTQEICSRHGTRHKYQLSLALDTLWPLI